MLAKHYLGTYARFETKSKKDAAVLLGPDNLVGDCFDITFTIENGSPVAWLTNRFGSSVGYLNQETSEQLSVLHAKGWKIKALLSFVAFTDYPEPGYYWGEVGIICHEQSFNDPMSCFVSAVSKRLAEGIRPSLDLGEQGFSKIIDSEGSWQPEKTVPLPPKTPGTAVVKSRRKISEKLIEEGRKGNKGCFILNWLFLLSLVAAIMFGIYSCTAS